MILIDGSAGEGGGQILRTALALSLVTGQSFRIRNIRAGRRKPGILRQHLTAIEAAVSVGGATAEGAVLGSKEISFKPGKVTPGEYRFSVGTAGSATLVLQTVLPALLVGKAPSNLILEGGTHNPQAPPFDFLQRTFLPLVHRMGPKISAVLDRAGFYPAGGGRFRVSITPCDKLQPIHLVERGAIKSRSARALVSHLPVQIAERELRVVSDKLGWPAESLHIEEIDSAGPGNVLLLELEFEQITEVFTGFGERGVLAETVAERAVEGVRRYLAAGAPVGEHLADQLLIPLAIAGGGSFLAQSISRHTQTNIEVIQTFCDISFTVEEQTNGFLVSLNPRSAPAA